MNGQEVLKKLESCEAILRNTHVVLTPKEDPPGSGNYRHFHSDGYVWKDRLYEDSGVYAALAQEIANRIDTSRYDVPEFVVGPEKGAIALASLVAIHLSGLCGGLVRSAYAEKRSGGGFTIGRGFGRKLRGSSVLVVEDIAVSGTTIRDTIEAVDQAGGIVILAFAICAREDIDTKGVPFQCLCKVRDMSRWPEEDCPRCHDQAWGPQSVRLDVNSHGREFLARKGLALP